MRDELEIRVRERIAELTEVNEALQKEISECKRTEEQIRAPLQEKEVLLREIRNRVKNNLQVISSLLSLQAGYIGEISIDLHSYNISDETETTKRSFRTPLPNGDVSQSLLFSATVAEWTSFAKANGI